MKKQKTWYWIFGGGIFFLTGLLVGGLGLFGLLPWQNGDLYEDPQGRFTMEVDPSWEQVETDGRYAQFKVPDPPLNMYLLVLDSSTVDEAFSQAFDTLGYKTWISGQDNELFGRFWQQCQVNGALQELDKIKQVAGLHAGPQTKAGLIGISCVEQDPSNRAFYYMIAVEAPRTLQTASLEYYQVPASKWAVFQCRGRVPDAIVAAEIYAFSEWLPSSGYSHALAPEMEVYPASGEQDENEFWLPIIKL